MTTIRNGAALLLALAPLAGAGQAEDARKALEEIQKELQTEMKELRAAHQAAADEEAAAELARGFREGVLPDFAERYAEIARAHRGDEIAVEAWSQLVGLAMRGLESPLLSEALATLVADHAASPALAELAQNLRYASPPIPEREVVGSLRKLAGASPHRDVQAAALLSLGAVLGDRQPAGEPRVEEAKRAYEKLAEYDDVAYRSGRTYADAARAALFELQHLLVGMPAPDFTAVDAEGAEFRLSDYRGKVVLLDFWGFW